MDNQRLVWLLIFSFSLIMLWEAWHKPAPVAPTPPANVAQGAVPNLPQPSAPPLDLPQPTATLPGTPAQSVGGAATMSVITDLYHARISSLGGDLVRLELTRHGSAEDRHRPFVLFDERHAYAAQSGLIGSGLPNHRSIWQLPAEESRLADGENELRVRLTARTEDGRSVAKIFRFQRDSYLIEVEYELPDEPATGTWAYFQLQRDDAPPEGSSFMMPTYTGPAFYSEQEKYQKLDFHDVLEGKAKHVRRADNGWVAMVQHYFVSAWLPGGQVEREFYSRKLGDRLIAAGVLVPVRSKSVMVPLYAGPQEQAKLEKIAPGFDLVVDYGWLTVIAAPLFWLLEGMHALTGNWGWAIILMTVLIKLAFFPLSAASYKSMAKMRVLTPKLMQLKETYGNDRMRLNREMMDLYKRENVNPLGGCLPILIQIPVFIALYWVLLGSVEMRQAPWLGWVDDLSAKDPYFILPLVMGVTMYVQMKLNPPPPDPIQAKILMMMPIIFTAMFLFFPSGLVLYWTVNNLLSIAQQWQINRMIEAAEGGGKR